MVLGGVPTYARKWCVCVKMMMTPFPCPLCLLAYLSVLVRPADRTPVFVWKSPPGIA